MLALKEHHRRSKKGRPNPYAERGLDHFALVSAELQAAKEILVAQLGTSVTSLSLRFSSGPDDSKWVPIFVPETTSKDELRALRRAVSGLVPRDGHLASGNQSARETLHPGNESCDMSMHAGSIVHDTSENTHSDSKVEEMCNEASSGHDSIAHEDSSEVHERAIVYCLNVITQGLLWIVHLIGFSVRTVADKALGQHAVEEMVRTASPIQSTLNEESVIVDDHLNESTTPAMEPLALTHSLCIVVSKTTKKPSKISSSPSTPRTPRQPEKPSKTSVPISKMPHHHGLTHHVMEALADKNVPHSLGQALTLIGLVVTLIGLFTEYFPAIVGVVCWWYVLPSMRRAVGDKPFVRSHHHYQSNHEDEVKDQREAKMTCSLRVQGKVHNEKHRRHTSHG